MHMFFPIIAACAPASEAYDDDYQYSHYGIPDGVDEFLTGSALNALEDAGVPVYRGTEPPFVEGDYLAEQMRLRFSDIEGETGSDSAPTDFRFYDQTDDGDITVDYSVLDIERGDGLGSFISGGEDCFTIFVELESHIGSCTAQTVSLISACTHELGFEDFDWGLMLVDKGPADTSDCALFIDEGDRRVWWEFIVEEV